MPRAALVIALLSISTAVYADDPDLARLLRYPDVSKTHIAFVHGGDIWVVPRDGGVAQRLTSGPGEELYPKFSPDGAEIAFAGEYSGTRQVWVVPTTGGTPRQLTFYTDIGDLPVRGGTDDRVLDWTPDGKNVLVRMNRAPYDERAGQPWLVPVDGGMERPLQVPETGGGSLSPDGNSYVYTPIDADWRGWKRYRGGRAPDVWTYDLKANTSSQLTTFPGMDQNPAWIGDTVYFASDRTGTLNLYAMPATAAAESTPPRALTSFTDFDVLWTSGGPDAIVFEQGGYVWRYDVGATEAVRVPIRLVDDAPEALPHFVHVADLIESFDLSPDGARAMFGARGEIFTVPAKDGEPRDITRTPAPREHSASWSPDGKWIAYLSDASGEYEIWVRAQDGTGDARRVTTGGHTWKFAPVWSPDSASLAFSDKDLALHVVDVASGHVRDVDRSDKGDFNEYTWSPDSRWLAYSKAGAAGLTSIWAWSAVNGSTVALTSGDSRDYSPIFDPQGRYLYFLSDRDVGGLAFGREGDSWYFPEQARIYAATLDGDAPPLGGYHSDEVGSPPKPPDAKQDKKDEKAQKKAAKAPAKPLVFDPAGFESRVVALKLPPSDYHTLSAQDDAVLYLAGGGFHRFPIDGDKAEDVADKVDAYALSFDRSEALVRSGTDWSIVKAEADQDPSASKLDLDRMELRVDPRVEWPQMYLDAWRMLRDWFYDPGLHGGMERWTAIRDRYAPLAAAVTTPGDFDYVLHELAGEVNSGHVYVERGPRDPAFERKPGGLLGADLTSDPSGYFRIAKIFAGEPWDDASRSPLATPGIGVSVGDFLISVDGVDARTVTNAYQLLEDKGGRGVELGINSKPTATGARIVQVVAIESEQHLRYLDWVASRRALVDQLSGGRIGYIHLVNTAEAGSAELTRWLPALSQKDALIIDDRYNGGGFIPDELIAQIAAAPLNYWKSRGTSPTSSPIVANRGPKAMLINGLSSSGGDALPYYFRELGLGPLIGTRTWGGLIGLNGNPLLADGSGIEIPNFRFLTTSGAWAIENEGVAPDIQVVDRPEEIAAGRDPSIEKAVAVLLAKLAQEPPQPLVAPAAPTKFP
jgi:tricorn protease